MVNLRRSSRDWLGSRVGEWKGGGHVEKMPVVNHLVLGLEADSQCLLVVLVLRMHPVYLP